MQCDPNSSAMLTRSIIKQVKPRLGSPAAEDWGISARCKSSTKPLQAPLELTGLKAVTHTAPALPQAPTFFITKKHVLWTISLPLGWVVPESWSLGSSNAISGWNSGMGQIRVALAVWCIYLGVKITGMIPVSSSQLGTYSAYFYWQKKWQGSAKEQAPQQRSHNQNWFCWAEEQRACLLQNVAVSGLECRKRHILAQILVLAYCNLNIPPW